MGQSGAARICNLHLCRPRRMQRPIKEFIDELPVATPEPKLSTHKMRDASLIPGSARQ